MKIEDCPGKLTDSVSKPEQVDQATTTAGSLPGMELTLCALFGLQGPGSEQSHGQTVLRDAALTDLKREFLHMGRLRQK